MLSAFQGNYGVTDLIRDAGMAEEDGDLMGETGAGEEGEGDVDMGVD